MAAAQRLGAVYPDGILRAMPGRGGTNKLIWFADSARARETDSRGPADRSSGDNEIPALAPVGEGPYGSRVWIFPVIPQDRRHLVVAPPAIANVIRRMIPADHHETFSKPMAWLQIPLPAGVTGVADAIQRIAVNCTTASNIEIWNEQLPFDRVGSTVTFRPEGNADRHLLGVVSVTGESGTRYVPDAGRVGESRERSVSREERTTRVPARAQLGRAIR
jgi:hypothetical protein